MKVRAQIGMVLTLDPAPAVGRNPSLPDLSEGGTISAMHLDSDEDSQ